LVQEIERLVIVAAPLPRDVEHRRWYGGNGNVCLVLTVFRVREEPLAALRALLA
jgi:hypothetical protein